MSKSAFSAKVFAVYLFVAGVLLATVPNLVLSLLFIPPTTEVWIRVIGVIAFMIGIYAWDAAAHEAKSFFVTSVYTRCTVFVAFVVFVALGLASPTVMLFGVADLLGGMWTYWALRADAQSANPAW
jgi:hypothetical protein